jgi:MFS family permease
MSPRSLSWSNSSRVKRRKRQRDQSAALSTQPNEVWPSALVRVSRTTLSTTQSKRHIHPGWIVLAAATAGVFMTLPGQTVGVSAFVDLFAMDLGLSRGTVLILYSVGTLVGILPAPLVGRLVDRWGPRRAIPVVVLAVSAGCAALATAQGPWTLALGFSLLRGSAIGGLSLVSINMVNLWFDKYRGRATAVAMMGLAAGGLVVPSLAAEVAATHGWRVAYAALGTAVAAVMLPVGLLFFRNAPESYGMSPDLGSTRKVSLRRRDRDLTLGEAFRTSPFWYLVLLSVLSNAVGTALLLDHVRALTAAGLARLDAIGLLGAVTTTQGLMMLAGGILIDRLGARRSGLVALAVLISAVVCVMIMPALMAGLVYSVALGASIGLLQVSQSAGLAEFFGTAHLGAIRGMTFFIGVIGAAAGPLPLAWSPNAAYCIFVVFAAVAMILGGKFVIGFACR